MLDQSCSKSPPKGFSLVLYLVYATATETEKHSRFNQTIVSWLCSGNGGYARLGIITRQITALRDAFSLHSDVIRRAMPLDGVRVCVCVLRSAERRAPLIMDPFKRHQTSFKK